MFLHQSIKNAPCYLEFYNYLFKCNSDFFCNIVKEFNKDWMSRKLIIHGKEMTRNIWRWQILFWVCQHSKQSIQYFLFPFYNKHLFERKSFQGIFFMYFLRTFDHRKKVCLSISRLFFYFKQTTSSKSKAYTFFHFLHTSCRQNIMHEKWCHSDLCGFEIKMTMKSNAIEIDLKIWGSFRICQLINTANLTLLE